MTTEAVRRAQELAGKTRVERARADIHTFIEHCFRDSKGAPIKQGAVHKLWHAHVAKHARAGINAPRDHGKSQQFAIYFTIFALGHNPNLRIKIVCNDVPKAKKRVKAIRSAMATEAVRQVFPDLSMDAEAEDWTAASITVKRTAASADPSVEARGILTAATGGRADLIIFDDVCDYKNSVKHPKERDQVKEAFSNDWINLLEPTGRAIYICTLWHGEDLTHQLLANPVWKFLTTVINERLDPIWPEMWPREALKARLTEIGPGPFMRGYQGKVPRADGGSLFNDGDLEMSKDKALSPQQAVELTRGWPKYIGVDLASGKATRKSKWGVIFVIAVEPQTRVRIPLLIIRKRELSPIFFRRLAAATDQFRPEAVIVENNAVQQALIDLAKASSLQGLPIRSIHTGKEKSDLEIGLPGMAVEFENQLWRLPYGPKGHSMVCTCNYCRFLQECRDGMDSDTTDILMAAWLSTRLIIRKKAPAGLTEFHTRSASLSTDWDPSPGTSPVTGSRRPSHHDPGW